MLTVLHRRIRRHRSQVIVLLAVLALATVGAVAHSALMNRAADEHMAGTATSICLIVGATLAFTGAAALVARKLLGQPSWSPVVLPVRVAPAAPAPVTVSVRAGPPPSLLQVFRF